jgi:hypothetical protein
VAMSNDDELDGAPGTGYLGGHLSLRFGAGVGESL